MPARAAGGGAVKEVGSRSAARRNMTIGAVEANNFGRERAQTGNKVARQRETAVAIGNVGGG